MIASVARRRRDDEDYGKDLQQQVKMVKILYLIARVMNVFLGYTNVYKYICFYIQMTSVQEVEVRVVGQGGRALNRLLMEISPEELLAVDPV